MSLGTRVFLAMVLWSPYYIVPTMVACLGARYFVRTRPRPALTVEDWGLFLLPYFVWFAGSFLNSNHKSLANFAEVYALIIAAVIGFVIRIKLGPRYGDKRLGLVVLAVVCVTGLGLAFLVPPLPE